MITLGLSSPPFIIHNLSFMIYNDHIRSILDTIYNLSLMIYNDYIRSIIDTIYDVNIQGAQKSLFHL